MPEQRSHIAAGSTPRDLQKDFQNAFSMSSSQFELLRKEGHFSPAIDGGDHKPLRDVRAAHLHLESALTGAEPIYVTVHSGDDIPTTAQSLRVFPAAGGAGAGCLVPGQAE